MSTPTAAWATPALMTSLARAGWGELYGPSLAGVRRVLAAVVDLTDHRSGWGVATRAQVAEAAGGLSLRWTSRCLRILEDLGVVQWQRGWLDHGRPRPGRIAIIKRALAALARAARADRSARDARAAARAAALARRIRQTLRWSTIPPREWRPAPQNTLSDRGELKTALPLYREESPSHAGRRGTSLSPHTRGDSEIMICKHGNDPTTSDICSNTVAPPRDGEPRRTRTRVVCATCGAPMASCLRRHLHMLAHPRRHPGESDHEPQAVTVEVES